MRQRNPPPLHRVPGCHCQRETGFVFGLVQGESQWATAELVSRNAFEESDGGSWVGIIARRCTIYWRDTARWQRR